MPLYFFNPARVHCLFLAPIKLYFCEEIIHFTMESFGATLHSFLIYWAHQIFPRISILCALLVNVEGERAHSWT
jgi:hypothetical protein